MSILNEGVFEKHIAEMLSNSDLYNQRSAAQFDIDRLCDYEMLDNFLKAQPNVCKRLERHFGTGRATDGVIEVYNNYLNRGESILTLLNKGLTIYGVHVKFVQFKPELAGKESEQYALYRSNRFSVVRQMRYSRDKEDSGKELDLCILINGIPIITCELKNEATGQNYGHGIYQYRYDRNPNNRMLKHCLVHFVMDNNYTFMTTQLKGEDTYFLPFNRDSRNPIVDGDYPTSYMWRHILQADSLLDIIQNFIKTYKKSDGKRVVIFPRYHQLRAVRKLRGLVREEGPGHNYLIHHSAGSGKTMSMAWLAHQLANMTNPDMTPIFDCIVMVTDRIVLNRNMAEDVVNFQTTAGTVSDIRRGSKNLATALDEGSRIIISTVQKFAFALEHMKRAERRSYAVIIDEAHTAIGNESAKDIVNALTTDADLKEMPDYDPLEFDSQLDAIMAYTQLMRRQMGHISYFAFTATPKDKTFVLYGKDGKEAHDIYSMKQAIDEKFILDVLQNYTTYEMMSELIEKNKGEDGEKLYEEKPALKVINKEINSYHYIMLRKATMMVEHFMEHTIKKIGRKAKAMVVCDSRKSAAEYKLFIDEIIKTNYNGAIKTLVAFSGEVEDRHGRVWTEGRMNDDHASDDDIRKKFELDEYRILIVADKFQTGFDQPLLHTMYVEKNLGGIQCIQTLSRLNRCYPGKEDTMIIDFRNDREKIQKAFQQYYTTVSLEGEVDTQRMYAFKRDIEEYNIFNQEEVDDVVSKLANKSQLESIPSILRKIIDERVSILEDSEIEKYRKLVDRYVRQYGFIAQLMTYSDTELEKFYVFCKIFYKFLPYTKETLPMEILEQIDLEKLRIQLSQDGMIKLDFEPETLKSTRIAEPTIRRPDDKRPLKEILDIANGPYVDMLNENDRIIKQIWVEVMEDPEVTDAFRADNSYDSLLSLVKEKFNEKVALQMGKYMDFALIMEKDQGFSMMLLRKFVDALSAITREEKELIYDEVALKYKMVQLFTEEFEPMSNYMRPLTEVVDYLFVVLNSVSIPSLDGINELVKDTLNQIYMSSNPRVIDKRRNFNQLVTKYEAFLKKLYYLIHGQEMEGRSSGENATFSNAIYEHKCLWGLRNNPHPDYKKFAQYLEQVWKWRNDESHIAPDASEQNVDDATSVLVAMYLYVTGWSITDLEQAGY